MVTFEELERQKQDMIGRIVGWPEEGLTFRPSAECWSVPEILDHLVKTESGIMSAVRRGAADPHRIGLRDKAGVLFLDRVFRSERQVKVPGAANAVLPSSAPELHAVIVRWSQERTALSAWLNGNPPDQVRGGVFRHPVAGWMSLPDVLNFFSVHIIHHEFQITRLEKAFRSKVDR